MTLLMTFILAKNLKFCQENRANRSAREKNRLPASGRRKPGFAARISDSPTQHAALRSLHARALTLTALAQGCAKHKEHVCMLWVCVCACFCLRVWLTEGTCKQLAHAHAASKHVQHYCINIIYIFIYVCKYTHTGRDGRPVVGDCHTNNCRLWRQSSHVSVHGTLYIYIYIYIYI